MNKWKWMNGTRKERRRRGNTLAREGHRRPRRCGQHGGTWSWSPVACRALSAAAASCLSLSGSVGVLWGPASNRRTRTSVPGILGGYRGSARWWNASPGRHSLCSTGTTLLLSRIPSLCQPFITVLVHKHRLLFVLPSYSDAVGLTRRTRRKHAKKDTWHVKWFSWRCL